MSVFLFGAAVDHYKPDSTLTGVNGDGVGFTTDATIDATLGLVRGAECLSTKLDVLKSDSRARVQTGVTSSELCLIYICKPTLDGSFSAPSLASRVFGNDTTAGQRVEMKQLKNGVSTTTLLWRFFYDNIQIGADQTVTIGNIYRVGIYVKLGSLSNADSTYSVYLDDVTSGVASTFVATQVITTTTATFTRTPASNATMEFGNASGSASTFGNMIYKWSHWCCIDTTSGGTFTDPVNRVTQPIFCSGKSVAVTVDASFNDWTTTVGTGDLADNTSGPDDATSCIQTTIAVAGADRYSLWTITPWSTVGNSSGDEIGCVRTSTRARGNAGTNGTAGLKAVHREGGTNVTNASYDNGTWRTFSAGSANFGIAFQQTAAGSAVNWTPALYNNVEMGQVCHDSGLVGTDTKAQLTWARTDALFRLKNAVSLLPLRKPMAGLIGR